MKVLLAFLGLVAIVLGFASWRFDFGVMGIAPEYLIGGGVALGAAMLWGRVIGPLLMGLALIPGGIAAFQLLFNKSVVFRDVVPFVAVAAALLVVGLVLQMIGSETFARGHEAQVRHSGRAVVCAACSQFLGTARAFSSPCPRCGSNRYDLED